MSSSLKALSVSTERQATMPLTGTWCVMTVPGGNCEKRRSRCQGSSVPFIADVGRLVTSAAAQAPLTHPLQVPLWIDLAAVVVGALAGAGVAVRERFDAVGDQ